MNLKSIKYSSFMRKTKLLDWILLKNKTFHYSNYLVTWDIILSPDAWKNWNFIKYISLYLKRGYICGLQYFIIWQEYISLYLKRGYICGLQYLIIWQALSNEECNLNLMWTQQVLWISLVLNPVNSKATVL